MVIGGGLTIVLVANTVGPGCGGVEGSLFWTAGCCAFPPYWSGYQLGCSAEGARSGLRFQESVFGALLRSTGAARVEGIFWLSTFYLSPKRCPQTRLAPPNSSNPPQAAG